MAMLRSTTGRSSGVASQAGARRCETAVAVAPCKVARPSRVTCRATADDNETASSQVNRRSMGLAAAALMMSAGVYTPSPASAAALTPNEETVAKYFKLLGSKTASDDELLNLVANSVVVAPSWPGAPLLKGKDGLKQYLARYRSTLSYISGKPPTFVAQGDSVVAFPTATYLVKSSKRTFQYTSAAVFKLNKEGRITSLSEYADTLTLDKEGVVWKK